MTYEVSEYRIIRRTNNISNHCVKQATQVSLNTTPICSPKAFTASFDVEKLISHFVLTVEKRKKAHGDKSEL